MLATGVRDMADAAEAVLSHVAERWIRGKSMKQAGHNPTEKSWRHVCDNIANGYVWSQAFLNRRNEEPTLDMRVVRDER
jgi:hypothetical protein